MTSIGDPDSHDTSLGAGDEDAGTEDGAPAWVKRFALAVAILVLILAIIMVATKGGHGPARHDGRNAGSAGSHR